MIISDKNKTKFDGDVLKEIEDGLLKLDDEGGGDITDASKKDVNFYDYDNTIIASYTAEEFLALSTMPSNPVHNGLTAQGWNWSLTDAQDYVALYKKLNIGQMYTTVDGKTRIYCNLRENRLNPYLKLTGTEADTNVTIDWGDNSSTETVILNTDAVYTPHTYAVEGDYVISIKVNSGKIIFSSDSSYAEILLKGTSMNVYGDQVYRMGIKKIEIGDSVLIGTRAFHSCENMESITIPNSITSIGSIAFYSCSSLNFITIPNSVTSIAEQAFYYSSLRSIAIPNSITSIGNKAFQYSTSLASITIPNSVTSIANEAFYYCAGFGSIKFTSMTPPIAGQKTFLNLSNDCVIYVPAGSLSEYTSAQYYPPSVAYTYIEY